MFLAIIERNEAEPRVLRRLSPTEPVETRHHAAEYANMIGIDLSGDDGHVPDGCGDFEVQIRMEKHNETRLWWSRGFYFAGEE